jgi:CheY-like chemotaxis protein
MRAVVVEPDAELCRRITGALHARGWTVLTARSYRDGLALIRRARAVAALCVAERLSKLTGPDLLAKLERDPDLAQIPAVLRVAEQESLVARALTLVGAQVVADADAEVIADAVVRASKRVRGVADVHLQAAVLCDRARQNCAEAATLIRRTRALIASSLGIRDLIQQRRARLRHHAGIGAERHRTA